jgi:nitrite reductase/ring-hydroxylating ferredoxin subunit
MTPPVDDRPLWRRDFPIDWPESEWVARRELVKFLVLVSAAFGTGQLWLLWRGRVPAAAPAALRIARADDVPVGGSLLFTYPAGGPNRILVRLDEPTFVAYEQQCTHLTCPVVPAVERSELVCPCHHGVFDLRTGAPLAGPPRRPLARVTLAVRDGWVWATGIEPRTA